MNIRNEDQADERAAFEREYSKRFCSGEVANMPRRSTGVRDYISPQQSVSWEVWKARALLSTNPKSEPPAAAPAPVDALREMGARKDAAYEERNRCVALIARMAVVMGRDVRVTRTAIEGWSDDWHGCIYIDLPTGQASWHFHDSQAALFADLPTGDATWDGHDTPEKYRRVEAAYAGDYECPGQRGDDPRGCWRVRCQLGATCVQATAAAHEPAETMDQAHERVQSENRRYGPLIRAAIALLADVDERFKHEPPLKYTIPYGAVNALRESLSGVEQPAASDRDARDDYAVEINRLRNVIQAACSGGLSHMIERWVALFPDAPVPTVRVDADQKTWCGYVGGMVGAHLGFDVDDPRNATIASIIERRLWAFPKEAK